MTLWDQEMLVTLDSMRGEGQPLLICAERIGVRYEEAVLMARERGIAGRMNRGNIPGVLAVAREKDKA